MISDNCFVEIKEKSFAGRKVYMIVLHKYNWFYIFVVNFSSSQGMSECMSNLWYGLNLTSNVLPASE